MRVWRCFPLVALVLGCTGEPVAEAPAPTAAPAPAALDPVATELRQRPVPVDAVRSIAFSPDGNTLAIGDGHGYVFDNTRADLYESRVFSPIRPDGESEDAQATPATQ